MVGSSAAVHAQSLQVLTQQAQGFDAAWQSAQAQYSASLSQSAQSKAALLPQAGVQLGQQYSDTRLDSSLPAQRTHGQQRTASLQLQQPLYNSASFASYQQGQRNADLAQWALESARQDLLLRVAKAYFQLLSASDNLQLLQAQKTSVREQLAYAQRNFELGVATVTDSLEAQSRFDLVQAQEIAAANDVRVAQMALFQLTGVAQAQPWPLAQPFRLPAFKQQSVSAWLDEAQALNPLIRQAEIRQAVAALETKKASAGHKPSIDLQASYSHQRNPDGGSALGTAAVASQGSRSTVGSVGVVMTIPVFSGFAVQNRVKETLALEDKAHADALDAQRQVEHAVRSAVFAVETASSQITALEAAVASSESSLQANQLGYEVGVRINMDVLNAQAQLYQAQKDLAKARYDLLLAHLQLRQAVGSLTPEDLALIDQVCAPAATPVAAK